MKRRVVYAFIAIIAVTLFFSYKTSLKVTDVFEGTDEMTLNKVAGRTQIMSNPTTYFTFEDEEANEIMDTLKK